MRKLNIKRIKEIREEKNISISEISEKLGYRSFNGYYKLERGLRKFRADHLPILAEILGVSIEDLFEEEKDGKE
ncbi:MAG: helix-turn-helix transcriptional regulator [Dictyoglomus thermophilum]